MNRPRPGIAAALSAGVFIVAVAVVVVLAVVVGGSGRDDFKGGSAAELTKALQAKGLVVCSSNGPDSGHDKGGSISTQVLRLALPDGCTGGTDGQDHADNAVDVQLDQYKDATHRDAAARNAEAQERQRNFGVVYTWHRFTVYLQGDDASGSTQVRDRIVDALDSVGAE